MTDTIINILRSHFDVTERGAGEFSKIRSHGMKFDIRVYDAAGAGSLCIMNMRAMFGLMKMETAVFSPVSIDGPIFSCDLINVFCTDTLFLELYDTTLSHPRFDGLEDVKIKHSHLPDHDVGTHWYDDIRLPVSVFKKAKKKKAEFELMAGEFASAYFDELKCCNPCEEAVKRELNEQYVNGLLENGGPAVDQFRKMLGDKKCEQFLKTVMFACGHKDNMED